MAIRFNKRMVAAAILLMTICASLYWARALDNADFIKSSSIVRHFCHYVGSGGLALALTIFYIMLMKQEAALLSVSSYKI